MHVHTCTYLCVCLVLEGGNERGIEWGGGRERMIRRRDREVSCPPKQDE